MIEEDGLDDYEESDSLLNERPKSTTSQQNFINWSVLLNGVPVQHLKILSLIGVLLTVATVFNVATAGYSLNHQKMLVELQSGRSTAYDTAKVNDHTMLQQTVQPTDLQQLKKLRASSLNQDNTEEFQSSTSNAANTKSLEEELFSATPTESNSLSESATDEESQKIRDERMEQDKTESKTKVSTRTNVDDGSDASTNIDTLSAVELGESSPEWNPQNSDNPELPLESENAAKKKSQKSSTDDSVPTEFSSPPPTSNVDVEISSSLQQQTSMIQKLQTQLEQQQEMMKQFRQQQLEMKKTAPDTGIPAGYSFPGGETFSTYALPPQEQNPAYYRQPIIPAPPGGGWVSQQQQPNLQPGTTQNTQYANYQQTATPGGWVPQQQQGAATSYPPQQPGISSGSMYVPLQQQQGDEPTAMLPTGNVMLPTGGIVANTQTQQYPQQPDSVMEYSPEAQSASTAQAPLLTDPGDLSGYKDAWDPHEATDTPVFWHVPKAGGSTVKDIMGTCHRMTMASEAGIADGHGEDTTIAVVKIGGDPEKGQDPSPFVNVDATTAAGLERAKALGLAQSGLADAIVTTYVYEANGLFDPQHRGRLFSVFRHPVDRAISMFQYLQYADWEPTYNPQLASMSIEEYAQSGTVENNWLTRIKIFRRIMSMAICTSPSDKSAVVLLTKVRVSTLFSGSPDSA